LPPLLLPLLHRCIAAVAVAAGGGFPAPLEGSVAAALNGATPLAPRCPPGRAPLLSRVSWLARKSRLAWAGPAIGPRRAA